MIEIKAVVRPAKLDVLRTALKRIPDFPGMTVMRVEGCSGNDSPHPHGLKQDLVDFSPKMMVFIVAEDALAERIHEVIVQTTSTERHGDGLIWTTPVQQFRSIAHAETA